VRLVLAVLRSRCAKFLVKPVPLTWPHCGKLVHGATRADKYYRVRVGPYADAQSATNARHDLEAKGFKSIVKR
jgi:SPOR domain